MPIGDELKELLKEEGWAFFFPRVMIFHSKIHPPQAVSLALFMDACSATFVVPLLLCHFCYALAYTITANGVCLCFLVPPLVQCSILQCFLLSCITACTAA